MVNQWSFTRLEIISDVVSERHVAEKTDVASVFPMWYQYFRCGIGIFPLRAFSDTTSEIISNRALLEIFSCEISEKARHGKNRISFISYVPNFFFRYFT